MNSVTDAPKENEHLSGEETARRRDEVVKRMIATPPTPKKTAPVKAEKSPPKTR